MESGETLCIPLIVPLGGWQRRYKVFVESSHSPLTNPERTMATKKDNKRAYTTPIEEKISLENGVQTWARNVASDGEEPRYKFTFQKDPAAFCSVDDLTAAEVLMLRDLLRKFVRVRRIIK